MYRKLTLCSDRGGYEAIPERSYRLDLEKARAKLEATGLAVVDARVLLVVTLPPEVTIALNGRLLFKTPDLKLADSAFLRLKEILELPA